MLLRRTPRGGNRGRNQFLKRLAAFMEELKLAFENGSPDRAEVKQDGKDEKQDRPAHDDTDRAIARAVSLLRARFVHKAAQSLLQSGQSRPFTDAVHAELSEKIPQGPPRFLPDLPAGCGPVLIASDHDLVSQIQKMASRGSSPGPTQISARHLKLVVETDIGCEFVAAVLSDLCSGSFSDDMKPLFLSAVGARVPKQDGTDRPICVGDTFYRLACSRLISLAQEDIADAVGPYPVRL